MRAQRNTSGLEGGRVCTRSSGAGADVARGRRRRQRGTAAEHEAFGEGVGGQPVRTVQPVQADSPTA